MSRVVLVTCDLCEGSRQVIAGGGRSSGHRKEFNLGAWYGHKRGKSSLTEGSWDLFFRYVCPDCAADIRQAIENAIAMIRTGGAS